jgi:integrase
MRLCTDRPKASGRDGRELSPVSHSVPTGSCWLHLLILQREQGLSSHVFMTERDGPMTPKAFHALFGRIGKRAKMPFPVHPHMLRHGCGYALANGGHDTRALQAWLGHKNIQQIRQATPLPSDAVGGASAHTLRLK